MSKYDELKRLAEAATQGRWVTDGEYVNEHGHVVEAYVAHQDGGRIGLAWANCLVPTDQQCRDNASFIAAANPAVILELIAEVEALREKTSELNFDAARYCYLATTTWSDDVTDALCTSDKDQIDQAIDAELMRASA